MAQICTELVNYANLASSGHRGIINCGGFFHKNIIGPGSSKCVQITVRTEYVCTYIAFIMTKRSLPYDLH